MFVSSARNATLSPSPAYGALRSFKGPSDVTTGARTRVSRARRAIVRPGRGGLRDLLDASKQKLILGDAEVEIAYKFSAAAGIYRQDAIALQLRSLNCCTRA